MYMARQLIPTTVEAGHRGPYLGLDGEQGDRQADGCRDTQGDQYDISVIVTGNTHNVTLVSHLSYRVHSD